MNLTQFDWFQKLFQAVYLPLFVSSFTVGLVFAYWGYRLVRTDRTQEIFFGLVLGIAIMFLTHSFETAYYGYLRYTTSGGWASMHAEVILATKLMYLLAAGLHFYSFASAAKRRIYVVGWAILLIWIWALPGILF